jgi:predicted outer membrane protein
MTVVGALQTTLISSTINSDLKKAVEAGLAVFEGRQKNLQSLIRNLGQVSPPH